MYSAGQYVAHDYRIKVSVYPIGAILLVELFLGPDSSKLCMLSITYNSILYKLFRVQVLDKRGIGVLCWLTRLMLKVSIRVC